MMNYIRFTFENVEPLKIADDSNSQSGEVNVLSYVPGSALRGAVINAFVKAGEFEKYKSSLLSDDVAFLNAYIMADDKELIPTFKGFYEDKTEAEGQAKPIENMMVKGDITPGYKRASLGRYCYTEDDCIFYSGVKMESDMKINKGKNGEKRNVFRNQYIVPGYRFAAYIGVFTDGPLAAKIKAVVEKIKEEGSLVLGGSRSFGYGKCTIRDVKLIDHMPYEEYALKRTIKDEVYMVLLSNMSMMNDSGEIVGIDVGLLQKKLKVACLSIENCATSVVDVRGYNRTWQTWIPSANMYEMGSVFKLTFPDEEISAETLKTVMNEGIGIRTNEGYGRVLFLDGYEKLEKKKEIAHSEPEKPDKSEELTPDEMTTLKIAAKGYYLNQVDKAVNAYLANESNGYCFNLNSSKLGTIESILYKNLYSEKDGFEVLDKYFENEKNKEGKKRIQKDSKGQSDIISYIDNVSETSLPELLNLPEKVMGIRYDDILTEKDIREIKQELIISQIRRVNREEVSNE